MPGSRTAIRAVMFDGEALLAAVAEHHPDVAVVDIRMPPTDTDQGLRAALQLRQKHPDTGVLMSRSTSRRPTARSRWRAARPASVTCSRTGSRTWPSSARRCSGWPTAGPLWTRRWSASCPGPAGSGAAWRRGPRGTRGAGADGRGPAERRDRHRARGLGRGVEEHVASIAASSASPRPSSDNRRVRAVLRYLGPANA